MMRYQYVNKLVAVLNLIYGIEGIIVGGKLISEIIDHFLIQTVNLRNFICLVSFYRCGNIFCSTHSAYSMLLFPDGIEDWGGVWSRVCESCFKDSK